MMKTMQRITPQVMVLGLIGATALALSACRSTGEEQAAPTTQPGATSRPTTMTASPDAMASDTGAALSASGTFSVRYVTQPSPIPLNEMFAINVQVISTRTNEPADDVSLSVDGRMPEHRHGMNVDPIVTKTGPGSFRVEGMLFHMPGRWEIHFDLTRGGMTERAWYEVFLE